MPSVDNLQQNSDQLHQKCQLPSHVPTTFTWSQCQWGSHVSIAGSFDPPLPVWCPIDMNKDNEDNISKVTLNLLPNKKYFYKFVIDGNWVLDPAKQSCPDESGNYNHVIEVGPLLPPPIPCEEEKNPSEEENIPCEEDNIPCEEDNIPYEEENIPCEKPCEEENIPCEKPCEEENIPCEEPCEEENIPCEEPCEEENIPCEEPCEEERIPCEEERIPCEEEKIPCEEEKIPCEEEKIPCEEEKEEREEKGVNPESEVEHSQDQKEEKKVEKVEPEMGPSLPSPLQSEEEKMTVTDDDQKERHLHGQIVHQHEADKIVSENHEKTEQMVDHSESTVTTGETIITTMVTTVTEEIIGVTESSTESSETDQSRNNSEESSTPEIETISSVSIVNTIIEYDNENLSAEHVANESIVEKTPNIVIDEETPKVSQYTSDGVNSEQIKEEMLSSNRDEGISLITTTTQEVPESEISKVSDEGLSKLSNEQSVEYESISESKVTEFIEDKSSSPSIDENHEQTEDILSVVISTTETYYYEDDNYDDNYDDDNDDDDHHHHHNKDDDNNEYLNYEDILSPEAIKEVILNHTWAKDDSMDETIPNSWTDTIESTAYVWTENWKEICGTHKSEEIHLSNEVINQSHEISSTSLVEETDTEQAGIPSSTNVNENLEKEKPAHSTIYNNESNMDNKTRIEKHVGEKTNMSGEKLENIISTSVAEPSSMQYEKPESSATADEKMPSMPTTVIAPANDQDMTNVDILKLRLIEKQESLGVNISACKISQRKISPISPSASSPGESTRNADMYTHNKNVATNTTRGSIRSKSKKPPIEIASRDVLHLQRDPKFVKQHDNLDKLDFSIIYLITSVATTFTLGIISMLFKSVIGPKRNK